MRLLRLALSNVRSYGPEPTVVEFGDGITLFWGEIGSGKSTLLAALEFGLFGLGDIKNTHLLRHRAARGEVAVTFASGETEYTVHRALVRGARKGDVRQVEGWIEADGERTEYSTTELKARVLELLGFNERPDPKASSRIYRYAVYTPQEEMKQVLLLGREERLDILRRAFGLEQYRFARRNVEEHLVRSVIAPRREVYAAEAQGLAAIGVEKRKLEAEADRLAEELDGVDAAIALIEAKRARLADEAAPFAGARAAFDRAEGELAALERVVETDEAEADALQSDLDRLGAEAGDAGDERRFAELADGYARWEALAEERSRLRGMASEHRAFEEEVRALETAIAREHERLEGRREALRAQLEAGDPAAVLATVAAETARAEVEESQLEAALAPEAEVAEETGLCQRFRGTFQARIEVAEREAERVLADAAALAAIGEGAACPTCRQTLTADHLTAITVDAEAEAGRVRAEAAELRDRLVAIERELATLGEQRLHFEQVRHDLVAVRAQRARLEGRRRELEQRLVERTAVVGECAALARQLEAGDFAADERERLAATAARRDTRAAEAARFAEVEVAAAALEAEGVVAEYRAALSRREAREEAARRRAYAEAARAAVAERLAARRADARERRQQLAALADAVGRLAALEQALAEKAERIAAAERERAGLEVEQARTAERLAAVGAERERLLDLEHRRQYLGEVQRWLGAHLVPAIAEIEEEVFERIRFRFEGLFADWFARLVEADDLEARVDETFSPMLRSGEYDLDLDLDSLSGGERTSLALAYRLALNTMVREEAGMGRESLLVLDEPTDGFSSGQLNRLRDILGETGCDQTVIVSHEQELEGVADRVYGVSKERGVSTVTPR
jgi:DNA repair protein SbcC/Rad50